MPALPTGEAWNLHWLRAGETMLETSKRKNLCWVMRVSTPGMASWSPWWPHTHTPPQVQLPCAIGGLGRTASAAVHLPELDGSTVQSHCYKQSHSSWEGMRSSIILFSILLCTITVAPSILLSSMLRSFMALPCYPVDDFTRVLWSGLLMTAIHPCLPMPLQCTHSGKFHLGQRSQSGSPWTKYG